MPLIFQAIYAPLSGYSCQDNNYSTLNIECANKCQQYNKIIKKKNYTLYAIRIDVYNLPGVAVEM